MSLLKIKVTNFKSYEDIEVEDFQKLNVIVGKNGAGKSNLIAALEFCLTDRYAKLNPSQRRQFLPSIGSITQKTPCHQLETNVEVVLDNALKRFSLASPIVTFRRRMTMKNDEYFVNNKPMRVDDYMGFLDNAGFWSRDSYFIVRHGQIENIVMSDPRALLDIIRQMFGSKHFEERRNRAMQSMNDAQRVLQDNQVKIDEACQHLEMYKFTKDDANNFKKLDKQRRFLKGKSAHFKAEALEQELKDYEVTLEGINLDKELLTDAHNNALQAADEAESNVDQKRKEISKLEKQRKESERRSKEIQESISDLDQRLLKLRTFDNAVDEEALKEMAEQLEQFERKRQELEDEKKELAKKLFDNKKEAQDMIFEVDKYRIQDKYGTADSQEAEEVFLKKIENLEKEIKETDEKILLFEDQKKTFGKRFEQMFSWLKNQNPSLSPEEVKDLKLRIQQGDSKIQADCRKMKALLTESKEIHQKLFTARYFIQYPPEMTPSTMIQSQAFFRNPIQELLERVYSSISSNDFEDQQQQDDFIMISKGYHGQIVQHLILRPGGYKPLEALLDNDIFAHVVSNRLVANTIFDQLKKLGIKYDSLRLLAADHMQLLEENVIDPEGGVVPFVECIQMEDVLDPINHAIRFLCQRKYIAQDLKTAQEFHARYPDYSFATVDGFGFIGRAVRKIIKKDAQTKFELYRQKNELKQALEPHVNRCKVIDQEIDQLDEDIKATITRYSIDKEALKDHEGRQQFREMGVQLSQKLTELEKFLERADHLISGYTLEKIKLETELKFWKDFEANNYVFPDNDPAFINGYLKCLRELKQQEDSLKKSQFLNEVSMIEAKKMLELYREKMNIMQEQLTEEEINVQWQIEGEQELLRLREESEKIVEESEGISEKISELMIVYEELKQEQEELKLKVETSAAELAENKDRINEINLLYEKCAFRLGEAKAEINEMGYVHGYRTPGIPDRYLDAHNNQIALCLREVDGQLEQMSAAKINPETIEVSLEIHKNLDELKESRTKQEFHIASILELINQIVTKRSDIIMKNIRQLGLYFEKYFKHFVPDGHAKIVLTLRPDDEDDHDNSSQSAAFDTLSQASRNILSRIEKDEPLHDNFDELGIEVSFNGVDNYQKMSTLSGGQKTIIAVTFVFAIQTILNLPFHLFDELDRNLDLRNRTALAAFVRKLAHEKNRQYVFASHYPELVNVANQLYGVSIHNGISKVANITTQEANNFLDSANTPPQNSSDDSSEDSPQNPPNDPPNASADVPMDPLDETLQPSHQESANTTVSLDPPNNSPILSTDSEDDVEDSQNIPPQNPPKDPELAWMDTEDSD